MRKLSSVFGAVAGLLWAAQAGAVNSPDYDIPYVAAQYAYEFSDDSRDSDDGEGYQLTFGVPLSYWTDWSRTSLELTFSDIGRKRNIDGNDDYLSQLFVNVVHDFGLFGWETPYLPSFKPFGTIGIGGVQDDVRGNDDIYFGAEAGVGLLFPTRWWGIAVRTEARAMTQVNDQSVEGEDFLIDYRLTAGLQMPLWMFFDRSEPVEPAGDCEVAVVDVRTGRRDCAADTDHDGVSDKLDQCPGTPSGTFVDLKGCPTGETSILRGVEFNTASAELTQKSKEILDNVAATLTGPDAANVAVEIGGHTDSRGNEPYNLMLSEQRAESVRQYLISKGVTSDQLVARGYGKANPIAPNDTPEGMQDNRRVEFKIVIE